MNKPNEQLASSVNRATANRSMPVTAMPDVAGGALNKPEGTLDWVGMSEIRLPLKIDDAGIVREVQARAQAYVNLGDAQAKGIHMSRLYLILDEHSESHPLTCAGLKALLESLVESHSELSSKAFVQFDFEYLLRRPALVSEYAGWNGYPVTLQASMIDGKARIELSFGVWYSSTCPASAALARQLIQEQFEADFKGQDPKASEVRDWLGTEEAIAGTPHGQRSLARVRVRLEEELGTIPITRLVDDVEDALSTPVQTAVKREDEQEFARLNAANLMFCEDAGRRLKACLDADDDVLDFWVRVEHHESLHAHDAVSVFTKGIEGGFEPVP